MFMNNPREQKKSQYFSELTLNLQHEGLTVKPETEDGLLPVELDGRRLCLVTESGGVRWREEDVTGSRIETLDRVTAIARTTAEYMGQMATASFLNAGALKIDYRLLAEFNGAVLAGHATQHGVQFVTWARDSSGDGLCYGHYFSPQGYDAAKQDFALRSGLVSPNRLFSDEQLAVLFDACQHMQELGLTSSQEQERLLEEVMCRIEDALPQVIDLANRLTEEPKIGPMDALNMS